MHSILIKKNTETFKDFCGFLGRTLQSLFMGTINL